MPKDNVESPLSTHVSLNAEDVANLLRILQRGTYSGIVECQAATLLNHKLGKLLEATNGRQDVPTSN